MKNDTVENVMQALSSTIDLLSSRREEFLSDPETNFTRKRKISFRQTIIFPMIAGSDNVATELPGYLGEKDVPRPSAMIQRRGQVRTEAFMALFSEFTGKIPLRKTFPGYQLAACDGSRISLPYNPSDKDTFIQCIKDRKGINQLHLNALYDPLNDIFLDVILQGIHEMDEKKALTTFLDKYADSGQKRIYICDRGYASYNIFAHAIHGHQPFIIRVPEPFAKKICTDNEHWLDGPTVDRKVTVHIGRRRTKALQQLENYHCIPKSGHYDYLEAGSDQSDRLRLRVLRFPIARDTYEYIVTDLPMSAFPMPVIKKLYYFRWGEEVAFRHLKYAGGMVHIHSLKKDLLIQEIYGKLTLYNFSSWITACAGREQKGTGRYLYAIDHTQAQKICARFLRGTVTDVLGLIKRSVVPVRLGRKFERCLRRQSADTLNYR